MELNSTIREVLRGRRICDVTTSQGLMRLVMVPERFSDLFRKIEARDGEIIGIVDIHTMVLQFAAEQIGKPYSRRALLQDAPAAFSCSTLTRFVFARIGFWLPRYAIEQSYIGEPIEPCQVRAGDLVFWRNRWPVRDQDRDVGHVGIVEGRGTFIDASNQHGCVDRRELITGNIECACRPLPSDPQVIIRVPPQEPELYTAETVADWLQRLR